MLKEIFITLSIVVIITEAELQQCRHDSECGVGECCYYHEGPLMVSKRQLILPTIEFQGGWCERYLLKGEHCSPFAKINGHCSCGPNLTCTLSPFSASSISLAVILPREYKCV